MRDPGPKTHRLIRVLLTVGAGVLVAGTVSAGPPPPPPPPPPPAAGKPAPAPTKPAPTKPAPSPSGPAASPQPAPQPSPPKQEYQKEPVPCPDGGTWHGHAPPHGDAYFCGSSTEEGFIVKNGWYVGYHEGGTKREECEYRQGKRHGRCTLYAEDGRRTSRGFFADGQRTGFSWFWDALVDVPADDTVARRAATEDLLLELGAGEEDVGTLGQRVLDTYAKTVSDIRMVAPVCVTSMCVAAGTVDGRGILAVELAPAPARIDAAEKLTKVTRWKANKRIKKERRRAAYKKRKGERKRRAYERALRVWKNTPLQCKDFTASSSCTCGGGAKEGCCAYNGGVKGCPRDRPKPPE